MACMGSVSEGVVDYCDDEQREGKPKPIDIESLLSNVIPQLLILSGQRITCSHIDPTDLFRCFRLSLLAGQELRLRISIRQAPSSSDGRPIHFCRYQCHGRPKCGSSHQNICCKGHSKVSLNRSTSNRFSTSDKYFTASHLGWTSQ